MRFIYEEITNKYLPACCMVNPDKSGNKTTDIEDWNINGNAISCYTALD